MKKFEDFALSSRTMKFIALNHFTQPTPIQEQVIPAAVSGRDVIGLSRTGTGKSHAFLIPVMERTDSSIDHVQAVITAPTRELAAQLYEKAKLMNKADPSLRIRLYVGGKDREKDLRQLKASQPHIAIGTPGRIRDLFLNEGALRIDQAEMLVIDEADMTLEYGFLNEIDAFAGRMGEHLQMLSFSATMPDQLKPFIRKYMHEPVTVRIGEEVRLNPKIRHILVPCYHHTYLETICSILPGIQPYVCLIFANTRDEAHEIAEGLRAQKLDVTELHGDMESRKRKQAMRSIEQSLNTFVVATDLAARGIDLDTVTHVISCGFPEDLDYYIHRAGRTGRNGSDGICYALYHEKDDAAIKSLQKRGIRFEHIRYRRGQGETLRPYGQKHLKPDDEMEKQIAMIMTKKNSKVKPGYKKKRAAAIDQIHRKKKREFIRAKIREEKKAMYRKKAYEEKYGSEN